MKLERRFAHVLQDAVRYCKNNERLFIGCLSAGVINMSNASSLVSGIFLIVKPQREDLTTQT